jgi:cytochrome P450
MRRRPRRSELPSRIHLPAVAQASLFWTWPFTYLECCRRRYGSRFTLSVAGMPPLVFLSNAKEIRIMLSAPVDALHPGEGGAMITPIVGEESFMLQDDDKHMNGRRAIAPAFHGKMVQKHATLVTNIVQREVASWPQDAAIALHPKLRALTLEIILRRIFPSSKPTADDAIHALRDRLLATLSVTASLVFPEPSLRRGPGRQIWERFLRHRAEADELIYALIGNNRDTPADPGDVLAMILAARNSDGSPVSRRQARDHIMSIILAGHETTASQLAWAFQLLAHNPTVQAGLRAEIDRGDSEDYLTATIQEVMRHRPVFLFTIPRAVIKPVEIGEWTYRPPARLLGCIYLLHHDPRIYLEPGSFRPERFLDAPPPAHLWLPWGGGRRRCPGLHLAMLEMKTVLRTALSVATVLPAGKHMERPRWRSVIVTPHAGARVVLRPRRQSAARTKTKVAKDGSRCGSAASIELRLPRSLC